MVRRCRISLLQSFFRSFATHAGDDPVKEEVIFVFIGAYCFDQAVQDGNSQVA